MSSFLIPLLSLCRSHHWTRQRTRGPPQSFSWLTLIQLPCYSGSVAQWCPILCDPMDCSTPGFPVLHCLLEFAHTHVSIETVMPSNHLILCRPLLLLPSVFPSTSVFFDKSAHHIRWSKDWNSSFSRLLWAVCIC